MHMTRSGVICLYVCTHIYKYIHFQEFIRILYPWVLDLISQSVEARQGCCVLAGSTFYFEKTTAYYYVLYIGLPRPADIPTFWRRYIDKISERAKRAAGRAAKPHAPPISRYPPPGWRKGPVGGLSPEAEKKKRFGQIMATIKCGEAKQNSKHCEQPY